MSLRMGHNMRFPDMLRSIIRSAGMGFAAVSREIGRSSGFIGNALSEGKPLRVDTLAAICNVCGYDVVIRGNGVEFVLTPSGIGKEIEITANVGALRHAWYAVPPLTDMAKEKRQTTVLEDDAGARVLVDYRILQDLSEKGWGVGWAEDYVIGPHPPKSYE